MLTEKLANDIATRTHQKLAEGDTEYTPADLQNMIAIALTNKRLNTRPPPSAICQRFFN